MLATPAARDLKRHAQTRSWHRPLEALLEGLRSSSAGPVLRALRAVARLGYVKTAERKWPDGLCHAEASRPYRHFRRRVSGHTVCGTVRSHGAGRRLRADR